MQNSEQYHIRQIAVDDWNATQIITQLECDGFNVVKHRQGMGSMSGPSKKLEELILRGELVHDNNPVMNWCASNVTVKMDAAENIKPIKDPKNRKKRIDGIVALIMSISVAIREALLKPSKYESEGVVII